MHRLTSASNTYSLFTFVDQMLNISTVDIKVEYSFDLDQISSRKYAEVST